MARVGGCRQSNKQRRTGGQLTIYSSAFLMVQVIRRITGDSKRDRQAAKPR
jgi:hypothetical protein